MLLRDQKRPIYYRWVVAAFWVVGCLGGGLAQAATIDSLNHTAVVNDNQLQGIGNTLDAILKAVNPNGDGESRVSTRVKESTYANSLNWERMFNSRDSQNQLPFADALFGGYIRHYFKIFLDVETDARVREFGYDKLSRLQEELISGDNQFNMNASGATVSAAVGNSYQEIKKVAAHNILSADQVADNAPPVNLLSQQVIKTQVVSDYPSSQDLLGVNRYNEQQQKRAALFVRSLLGGVDVMSDIAATYSNNRLEICLPDGKGGYRWVSYSNIKEKDYKKFQEELSKLKLYQEFKIKQLAANALRSVYTANMVGVYSDRVPQVEVRRADSKSVELKSVAELEEEVARMGLDKEYLESVKRGTVADFQMEQLVTLNRIVYFLHKIHRDCERSSLAMSAAAIKLAAPDATVEHSYYTPIGKWIQNECWRNSGSDQCKNLGAGSDLGDLTGN